MKKSEALRAGEVKQVRTSAPIRTALPEQAGTQSRIVIGVVGGGAAGAAAVEELVDCGLRTDTALDILLIDPCEPEDVGRGIAWCRTANSLVVNMQIDSV